MTKLKLSDLESARALMTPGQYGTFEMKSGPFGAYEAEPDGYGELVINAPTRTIARMPDDEHADDNAAGIAATHSAADVLIRIAKAAVAWRDCKGSWAECDQALLDTLEGVEL